MCNMRMDRAERDGRDAGGRAMTRSERMARARAQALLVRRLREQLRETTADGLHSMRLDGMPQGRGGVARGLDVRMEKREAIERILNRESALLRRYEAEAREEMDGMRPEHYAFCALYFIAGLSLAETAEAIDRSERQCMRYKREIEQEE